MDKKKEATTFGALIENMKYKKNPLDRKQSYVQTFGRRKVCKSYISKGSDPFSDLHKHQNSNYK